jgi:PAS domain S-box-containing protein
MSKKGSVLVVDDNPFSSDAMAELLRDNDYTVVVATKREDALALIPDVEPDLILLDAHLRDSNAFRLCAEIKSAGETRDVSVVFMTSVEDESARTKGFELGDDLIMKPFEPREVLARVERQVTVSRVRMALRESEAKFRSVMESAIDAIISGDVDGKIRTWNRAATALFGHSAEDAVGQPIELIIPHRYRERHREGMDRVSGGGESRVIGKTVELEALRKDGTEFPIELSLATWMLDEERYYTGIIRDISERKQAEQKFRSVTESAIDAIISADHTGKIVSWNSAATRILGHSPEEAVGQQLEIIIPLRFHEAHREGMKRVTERGESRVIGRTVELFARTKAGKEVPIELSLSTWTVHDERYYTGIIRDISERKEAEAQLRDYTLQLSQQHEEMKLAQAQLVETEKQAMLGRLLAGLLHELNTPLGALRSAGDSVGRVLDACHDYVAGRSRDGDAEAARALRGLELWAELSDVFSMSTERIQAVVNGLKHFVDLDGAGVATEDLRTVLDSAIMLIGPQAGDRITIHRRYLEAPALVTCDPARLNQAFLNVLQNAVEAIAGEGEIHVSVGHQDDRVEVRIRDTGCGMTEQQIADAFDLRFYSKDGRVRLGLGLAASRRSVTEAGGTLTIDSETGKGTTVVVTLPRVSTPRD